MYPKLSFSDLIPVIYLTHLAIFLSRLPDSDQFLNPNLALNLTCKHSSDCFNQVEDSHCSLYNSCECNYGTRPEYLPGSHDIESRTGRGIKLACVVYKCMASIACTEFFKSPSDCDEGVCRCAPGYKSSLDRCQPIFKKLGGKCTKQQECGPLATCGPDRLCECTFGSIKANDIACTTMPSCHGDKQCQDLVPYTICQVQQCLCMFGFHLNPTSSRCDAGLSRAENCKKSDQCGDNAFCSPDRKRCFCKSGYEPHPLDSSHCLQTRCRQDKECQTWDRKLICYVGEQNSVQTPTGSDQFMGNHTCQCRKQYILNETTQKCVRIGKDTDWTLILSIVMIVFIFVCIVVCLSLWLYYRRALRIRNR